MEKLMEGIGGINFANAFLRLFMDTNDILWVYDTISNELYLSNKFTEVTGYETRNSANSMQDFYEIIHPSDRKQVIDSISELFNKFRSHISIDFRILCIDGETKHVQMRGSLRDSKNVQEATGASSYAAGTITDASDKRKMETKLNQMAYYDGLTQLPNKSMFTYRTTVAIRQKAENTGLCAVVYLDIDNFKRINDINGHYFGDDVLKQVGNTITEFLKPEALVARQGGDEFLILFPEIQQRDRLALKLKKLLKHIAKPMLVNGKETRITCSTGVATYPTDGINAEELIKNADAAVHRAKEEGRNKNCFYEQSINADIVKRMGMEKSLRGALERNELGLVYQPQMDIKSGKISGLEALLRWYSPIYGAVPPQEFIPIAEDSGLIIPIGLWVLQQVCMQNKKWQENGLCKLPIYVNLSPVQLKDERLFTAVSNILDKTELEPEYLRIEITESVFVDDFKNAAGILKKLRNKGIRIALDDFGTGYSSLNYLKSLPLDVLKIDKTFIKDLKEGKAEKAIAGTIVSLAHILNMSVVAEGVETREQFEYLRGIGCNLIQGYYISKPLLVNEIENMIKAMY